MEFSPATPYPGLPTPAFLITPENLSSADVVTRLFIPGTLRGFGAIIYPDHDYQDLYRRIPGEYLTRVWAWFAGTTHAVLILPAWTNSIRQHVYAFMLAHGVYPYEMWQPDMPIPKINGHHTKSETMLFHPDREAWMPHPRPETSLIAFNRNDFALGQIRRNQLYMHIHEEVKRTSIPVSGHIMAALFFGGPLIDWWGAYFYYKRVLEGRRRLRRRGQLDVALIPMWTSELRDTSGEAQDIWERFGVLLHNTEEIVNTFRVFLTYCQKWKLKLSKRHLAAFALFGRLVADPLLDAELDTKPFAEIPFPLRLVFGKKVYCDAKTAEILSDQAVSNHYAETSDNMENAYTRVLSRDAADIILQSRYMTLHRVIRIIAVTSKGRRSVGYVVA